MADIMSVPNEKSGISDRTGSEQRFGVEQDRAMDKNVLKNEEEKATEQSTAENDQTYHHILSQVQTTQDDDHGKMMQDASVLHQQMDRESQIKHLIDLAMMDGVEHAVKVAQKAEDYYVLDQLHDRLLSQDLHEALMAKGLIEK